MKKVLDTDTLSYFLKGNEAVVRQFSSYPDSALYTTTINCSELLFGAFSSIKKKILLQQVSALLAEIQTLPFCEKAAYIFAEQKADLRQNGTPVADMDLMIASIAIAHEATLVTNNIKHFSKVKNLHWENWVTGD